MAQHIPEETIEEIRNRCDIVNVINEYVPLQKKGSEHWACCPFHQEKTPSFKVNSDYQSYYCFGCHVSGNVFKFVMAKENVDFVGAVQLLARRSGVIIPEADTPKSGSRKKKADSKEDIYEVNERIREWYQKCLKSDEAKKAEDYLKRRGIDDEAVRRFALGYAPDRWEAAREWGKRHGFSEKTMIDAGVLVTKEYNNQKRVYDRFRGRLIFPIWDELGRVVGFSGRSLDPAAERAKYINSPETSIFKKGRLLYGLHLARPVLKDFNYALICEGQLDVIACHRAGLTNAVAPQGTAFTEAQARVLRRFTDVVVFCFDSDEAGLDAAKKSIKTAVSAELQAKVTLLPPDQDPDSIYRQEGAETLKQLVEDSQDGFDFLFDQAARKYPPETPEGKENLISILLEVIVQISKPVTRAALCQWLSHKTQVPESAVFDTCNTVIRRQQKQSHNLPFDSSGQALKNPQDDKSRSSAQHQQYSQVESAKIHLLDLALHHGPTAHKLAENEFLSPPYLTSDAIDKALALVLRKTTDDEWGKSGSAIAGKEELISDPRIARILAESHYSHLTAADTDENDRGKKERQLQKVLDNCLLTIEKHEIEREIDNLSKNLGNASDNAENRRLLEQYQALVRRKNQLRMNA